MAKISDYLENKLLDHVLRNTALSAPTAYLALHTADPGETGTSELGGGGYARAAAGTWDAAASRSASNTNAINFPTITAAVGTVTHAGIWDAVSGGNLLWYSSALSSTLVTAVGLVPQIAAGALTVSMAGDVSTYLANEWLDHILGTGAYTTPGTSIYVSAHDGDPGLTGANEISGNAYARVQVTAWDAPASGATENTNAITFPTPTPSDWGTITHAGIWDASTSGNFLMGGDLDVSLATSTASDPLFGVGGLDVVVQ